MTLKLYTAPTEEPITLAEAKLQCRVESSVTEDDALITSLIVAARSECEHLIGRALVTQVWERVIDAFPQAEIELGMPPVQSINQITYVDTAGATQTLVGGSYYVLDNVSDLEAFALPAVGYTWPATLDTANAVRVRFTAGYGAASAVPDAIKAWLKIRVATLYKFREQLIAGVSVADLPRGYVDALLDRYRIYA